MSNSNGETGLEIAVIGMAGRFPGAKNINQFWDNLKNGVESLTFYSEEELLQDGVNPRLLENPDYVKSMGGLLEDKECFDASFFGYSPAEAEILDPQVRVFHECAWHALENAGYDPFSYDGLIGLYAGASFNLFWEALSLFSGKIDVLGGFATWLLIDRDFLCTRVSYSLNLKGPSVIVKSACSTSLVAVHMACQAILNGECDMALAGGVTITRLNKSGYLYQEDMINSPDGHCRAFDAGAEGTAGGDGVGIVVLKRLEEAITDGDYIYAVIKGTAINNDGIRKAGYTAPSIIGQSEVIRDALRMAEVDPETITYMETHGTGTPVGDPIEIEGLKTAFNTTKKGFCRIGSVKTNVGHLDAAAGVAGFIKTVLALDHKLIPPSLHFKKPNPKIDFENSPFYVNAKLCAWEHNGHLLRAGVSSFGVGGTNAHVILEETPGDGKHETLNNRGQGIEQTDGRKYKLILLSARTKSALERTSENLKEFLIHNPEIDLANAAYTLQLGRCALPHRRMVVCSDVDSAIEALSSKEPGKHPTFYTKDEKKSVIFMFAGLGAQYVNMGLDLFQTESLFREEIDRCFDILEPLLDYNIKSILYPIENKDSVETVNPKFEYRNRAENKHIQNSNDRNAQQRRPLDGGIVKNINQVEIAQLVIFILEYALAKLLMNWGIKPQAMIGYSFGEYTAACLSGVFSLEDALKLIVIRGQLIQRVPGGSMLSVPLPANQLIPLLTDELSLSIDNGPSSIVSGPIEVIEIFEKQLREKRLLCMKLPNSHAIHSKMMEPILEEFEEHLGRVQLNRPRIPYISNVTGNWITVQEAVNPTYWSRHLKETVQFATGINELQKEPNAIFIEIGPGRDLSTLLVRHKEDNEKHWAVNLIRQEQQDVPDDRYILSKIGQLWLHGIKIDWQQFYAAEKRRRISLPDYPFERQPYWIEGNPFKMALEGAQTAPALQRNSRSYLPSWQPSVLPLHPSISNPPLTGSCWLMFIYESDFISQLLKKAKEQGVTVLSVKAGTEFKKIADFMYSVNPQRAGDYDLLLSNLQAINRIPDTIVHLWGISETDNHEMELEFDQVLQTQELGLYSLLHLARSFNKQGYNDKNQFKIKVITNNMQKVPGDEGIFPEKAPLLAAVEMIPREYSNIKCCSIDISFARSVTRKETVLTNQLLVELRQEISHPVIAYRGHERLVRTFVPAQLAGTAAGKIPSRLKEGGVYLVIGKLENIGFEIARYLALTLKPKLVLIENSGPQAFHRGNTELSETGAGFIRENKNQQEKESNQNLQQLEQAGADVLMIDADIMDYKQMQQAAGHVQSRCGDICGVIYSTGTGIKEQESRVHDSSPEIMAGILEPEIKSILVLDKIFNSKPLDFFVHFAFRDSTSKPERITGNHAAKIFIDSLVHYKLSRDVRFMTSIHWDSRVEAETNIINVFESILENSFAFPQVVVSSVDPTPSLPQADEDVDSHAYPGQQSFESTGPTGKRYQRPELSSEYVAPGDSIEKEIAEIWQKFFSIEQLGIYDDFLELGADSLAFVSIASKIHKALNVNIPIPEFFYRLNIKGLAEYIKEAEREVYSSIELSETKDYYALSSVQRRLFVLHEMDNQGIGYNLPFVMILEGDVDKASVQDTFRRLIKRHESLRTSFEVIDGEPVQKIHKMIDFEIEYYDMESSASARAGEIKEEVDRIIKDFIRFFDLSRTPLLRVGLIKEKEAKHILMVDKHHIISDGVSFGILVRDFMALHGGTEIPNLKIQYKDFAEWQDSQKVREFIQEQEKYWLRQFAGEIPVLNLPADFQRPVVQSFEGSVFLFGIDKKNTAALKKCAFEEGATLFMVLLAVYNILLAKITDQEDIVVGTPIAGRRHDDLEPIVGMFVNTLVLRNFPEGEKNFREFLAEVKERTLEAYSNQDYLYEELVNKLDLPRDTGRNPLFDAMFILQSMDIPVLEIPGLKLSPYSFDPGGSIFDLIFQGTEIDEALACSVQYCTKLFKQESIERFIFYFKKIISAVIESPEVKISALEVMSEMERKRILYDFNDTRVEFPGGNKTVHELFEQQTKRSTGKLALIFKDHQLTYGELNKKANQLARLLRSRGIGSNDIVGLMLARSVEMIISIIAVMKAGGAYLAVDLEYPVERKKYMIEDSSVKLLLANEDKEKKLNYIPGEIEIIDPRGENIYFGRKNDLDHINSESDMIYLIYTSGSTGKPKGVILEHVNLVNLLIFGFEFTNLDFSAVLQFSTISFDVSFHEIFSTLLSGGVLCLVDEEIRSNVSDLFNIVEKNKIRTLFFPMSFLKVIFSEEKYIEIFPDCISHIQTAGEQVVISDMFKDYLKRRHIYLHNHYGPAESHVVTTLTIEPEGEIPQLPPIGKPVSNTYIYILDRFGNLQPLGVPGELFIGGIQVGRGYLNRPETTAERFIYSVEGGRLYRTGDLSRWLTDSNIEFLGRIDHQVKLRGFRVELGEIETQLLKHEEIKEVVVVVKEDGKGDKYLCAYIVSDKELSTSELRIFLTEKLPDYMIPAHFVSLDSIPLTPNGKIDRKVLPAPEIKTTHAYIAPRDEMEEKLAELWSEALGIDIDVIGIDANFFELGGHSLKAMLLTQNIHKEFNVRLSLAVFFNTPQIRKLSEHIKGAVKDKFLAIDPVEEKEYYPLSSAQKRLYYMYQVAPGNITYNMSTIMVLEGNIDRARLNETFKKLVKRHESLRTSFVILGKEPVQKIHKATDFAVEFYNSGEAEGDPTGAQGESSMAVEEIIRNFILPFKLSQGPLIKVGLVEERKDRYILMVNMHHIITDGVSNAILVQDFMTIYAGKELANLKLQYTDFSEWQNSLFVSGEIGKQEEYWLNRFEGDIPVLNLPTDYPRPVIRTSDEGDLINFMIEEELTERLNEVLFKTGTTMFMFLLAVFNILLSKYSGQEDIVVGSPVSGRRHSDLENMIGILINMLNHRNRPEGHKTFREFLEEVKENAINAYENQDYQFDELISRLGLQGQSDRNPLFSVVFADLNMDEPVLEIPGLTLKPFQFQKTSSKFDLRLAAAEYNDVIMLSLTYSTTLFKRTTTEKMIERFIEILEQLLENIDIKLHAITISHDLSVTKSSTLQDYQEAFDF